MLTRYRFGIKGSIRLDKVFPIRCEGYFIEFVLKENRLIALNIYEETDIHRLSSWTTDINGIKSLNIQGVNLSKIQSYLIKMANYLAVFGLREVEIDSFEIKWIPSNDKEKEMLEIESFSSGYKGSDEYKDTIPFDLLARPVIAAFLDNGEPDMSMSFYRKGCADMEVRAYIEAFYDFFYVLETKFGDGQQSRRVRSYI